MSKTNENFNDQTVTVYSISEKHEKIFRITRKQTNLDNEILISKGYSDKKNILPFINLFSTSFIEVYPKETKLENLNLADLVNKLEASINKKSIKLLGFFLKMGEEGHLRVRDAHSGITINVENLFEIITLLMLSRATDKQKSNSNVGMDVYLSELNSTLETNLHSNGFWKDKPAVSKNTFMAEFYHSIYSTAIMQIHISPIISEGCRFSDNDIGIHGVKSLIELAWIELFIADTNRIKFSICPCCGMTYSLEGTGNWRKMTCGKEECRKIYRAVTDKLNRLSNEKTIKKAERFRKAKNRAIHAILNNDSSVEDQAKKLNISTSQIENWINEYKLNKKKKKKLINAGNYKCNLQFTIYKIRIHEVIKWHLFKNTQRNKVKCGYLN